MSVYSLNTAFSKPSVMQPVKFGGKELDRLNEHLPKREQRFPFNRPVPLLKTLVSERKDSHQLQGEYGYDIPYHIEKDDRIGFDPQDPRSDYFNKTSIQTPFRNSYGVPFLYSPLIQQFPAAYKRYPHDAENPFYTLSELELELSPPDEKSPPHTLGLLNAKKSSYSGENLARYTDAEGISDSLTNHDKIMNFPVLEGDHFIFQQNRNETPFILTADKPDKDGAIFKVEDLSQEDQEALQETKHLPRNLDTPQSLNPTARERDAQLILARMEDTLKRLKDHERTALAKDLERLIKALFPSGINPDAPMAQILARLFPKPQERRYF